ncbi:hypothetical protein RHS03_06554, partial [Rhizoctonia solani]
MKFCTFSILLFVSLVAALPQYPTRPRPTSPTRATAELQKQVASPSYAGLITIAASSFNAILFTYGSLRLPLSSLWSAIRGNVFHGSSVDTLSMMLLPNPSRPSQHGKCAEDQFWFGPKQTCVGGTGTEDFIQPPTGYYCPIDWSFSYSLGCCMPHTPQVVSKNDCGDGNGAWDLIRM